MKGKYNMNTKQNLFTEEELAKVTDEAERKHLIECAQDQSKIDMKYMEIMSKYDLWEKGKRSRYFHATTHENAKKIMQDGVIRKGIDGGVYICKQPLEAARFVAIRGHETGTIFELMKKLQRLAERGVGGEKEGAQKKLQQLMKKYDIEESDLSDDKLEDHEWKYHNDFELRLLKQTIYKVLGKDGLNQMYHYRSGKGKKTIQGVQCTKAQAIQIGIEYEFYCETWKEEHDFFFKCFVQKHKIFPTKEEMIIRPQDDVEMSDEDAMRMQMAMSAMKDKSMTQRIEG